MYIFNVGQVPVTSIKVFMAKLEKDQIYSNIHQTKKYNISFVDLHERLSIQYTEKASRLQKKRKIRFFIQKNEIFFISFSFEVPF
jgi:hypothetical protein